MKAYVVKGGDPLYEIRAVFTTPEGAEKYIIDEQTGNYSVEVYECDQPGMARVHGEATHWASMSLDGSVRFGPANGDTCVGVPSFAVERYQQRNGSGFWIPPAVTALARTPEIAERLARSRLAKEQVMWRDVALQPDGEKMMNWLRSQGK